MKKRIISLVLAVLMVVSLLPVTAAAKPKPHKDPDVKPSEDTYEGQYADQTNSATLNTAPVAANNLTYDGSEQALLTTGGTATNGTVMYSLDNTNWSENIPVGKDAGEYTVYYMVKGDDSHYDLTDDSYKVTVTISNANYTEVTADYTLYLTVEGGAGTAHKNSADGESLENLPDGLNYDDGVWTMTDFAFTTTAATAVVFDGNTVLNLVGENKITSTYNGTDNAYGLRVNGDLTVQGTGSLSVTGGTSTSSSYGIYVTQGMTVTGGDVTITASETGISCGKLEIKDGTTLTIDFGEGDAFGEGTKITIPEDYAVIGGAIGEEGAFTADDDATQLIIRKKADTSSPWQKLQKALADEAPTAVSGLFDVATTAEPAGYIITLLTDFKAETGDTTLTVSGTKTLDLNGHVLNGAGITTVGSVIAVPSGANLTIQDSNTDSKSHKFTPDSRGLWVLDETSGTKTVTGGVITGGTGDDDNNGGGVIIRGGTLMLNGGNIVGNRVTNQGSGVNVNDGGTFTMLNGNIVGNYAGGPGGGVYVIDGTKGIFTLKNGCVSYNTAVGNGGGVCAAGDFTMEGGIISCNSTKASGGGVRVAGAGTFKMTAGTINNNTAATSGGGVDVGGTVTLGGTAKITGNYMVTGKGTEDEIKTANNLFLPLYDDDGEDSTPDVQKTVILGTGTDEGGNGVAVPVTGDSGMKVGVTMATAGQFTASASGAAAAKACFSSDDADYDVRYDNYETTDNETDDFLKLVKVYAITNGAPEASATGNHGYLTIDMATAAKDETVTITVNPATGYQLKADSLKGLSEKCPQCGETLTSAKCAKCGAAAEVEFTFVEGNTYTFAMPACAVTVTAAFEVKLTPVDVPTATGGLVYTGEEQTGVAEATGYTVTDGKATAANNYTATATLAEGYKWSDGTTNAKEIAWSIGKAQAEITVDQTSIVKTYGEAIVLPTATSNFGEVACDKTAENLVNVGSYTVTYTVADTANYDGDTKTVSVTIGRAPLTVTAKAKSIAYGDAAANDGVEYEGFVNGETADDLGGTLAYAYKVSGTTTDYTTSSPVGTYDIIPSGLTSDNYEIKFVKGTLTVGAQKIAKPTAVNKTYIYDGTKQSFELTGFNENTMTISGNEQTNANETGYTVTVIPKDNYAWTTEGNCEFTWVIGKANYDMSGVTFDNVSNTYDGSAHHPVISGTLPTGADGVQVTVSYSDGQTNVGEKTVTATFATTSTNYNTPTAKTAKQIIMAAEITNISVAQTGTLTYSGQPQTATVDASATTVNSQTASFTYCDTETGTYDAAVPGFTAAGEHTVYYKVTAPNHGEKSGSFTVTIDRALLTVTAKDKSIAYGDAAANAGVEYSGFVNSETASVLGGTLAYAYKVSGIATDYTTSSPVGTYDIIPSGLTSDNYEITFVNGTLTVGAQKIAKPTAVNKTYIYDGTKQSFELTGFNENTMTISGNEQTNANETGYTVTVTPKDNYVWSTTGDCEFTWKIAKAALTAKASTHEVTYGDAVPSYEVTYTGWKKGEETPTTAAALTSEYTTTSNVGEYAVTFETVPVFANYSVKTENGKVTVERAKTAAEPTVASGLVYTGKAQNGYTNGGTHVTLGGTSFASDAAESYSFTATPEANYAWSDGTTDAKTYNWSIGKAQAVITGDQTPIVKTYGEAIVLPTATSNFGEVACDKTAGDLVNVGTYTVTYSVAGTTNYDGDTKTVSVTINPLAVNEPSVTGTYTYTGSEQSATVTGKADYMTETGDVKGTDAGDYTITYTLDENHCWADGSDGTVSWSIAKADMVQGETITAPSIPVSELVYTGEALELLCAGVTLDEKDGISPCGTFYYSVNGEDWSTDLPTAINAGKYNPVWYFVGDKNHNNIGSADEPITQPDPVEILKTPPANAPSITASDATITKDTVTLPYDETYEYQMDNGDWQSGEGKNIFANLDPATQHTFKVRLKETKTAMPSNEATITVYTAAATPANVAATGTISYTGETFELKDGYEISKKNGTDSGETFEDGKLTPDTNKKVTLEPGTTYYIRKAASGGVPASETVSLTIPARPTTPGTPELVGKTDTTVTVTAVAGQEYSLDGTTWQDSGEFTGLTAGTAYTVYTRTKAVTTGDNKAFASESSTALSVSAKTAAANAPSITPTVTATSVVLPVAGEPNIYEYSTDGTNWNDTHIFTGLKAETQYTYYVRVKETGTAMPSQTATVSVYTNQPAPKKGDGYTISSYDEKGQPIIAITSGYEVSTSPDFDSTVANGTALTVGETYYVRKAANGSVGASAGTSFVAIEQPKVTVSAISSDTRGGTVRVDGVTGGVCFVGTSVTVTATANAGYKFTGWYDGEAKTEHPNPYTFTANEATILTAKFVVDKDKVEIAPVSDAAVYGSALTLDQLQSDHYTVTSDPAFTGKAGTYKLTAKLEDGYVWEDGTTADKTFFYTVNKEVIEETPENVTEDVSGNSITGFDSETMEWRRSDADGYTSDAPTNLDYGTYYVRMKGDANREAGKDIVIVLKTPVTTNAPTNITASSVTLNGTATDGTSTVTYQYRKVGSDEWLTTDGNLIGLSPDTEYEFCAVVNGAAGETKTFRTEKKNQPTGSIQVHVKGADSTPVTVTVEQGNTIVATRTGSIDGNAMNTSFAELADGYYNLVVSTGSYTETRLLEVKNGAAVNAKFDIPTGTLSSVVEVKKDTPKVAVDGLADLITEEEADAANAGSKNVGVSLEVEKLEENIDGQEQIQQIAGEQTIDAFIDMSLFKTTTEITAESTTTTRKNIGSDETNPVLEIVIPYDTNHNGLQIYHYHNGVAKKLAKLSDRPTGSFTNGSYYIGDGYLFVYTNQFSTYAIGYEEEQDDPYYPDYPDYPVTPTYTITGADTENGKLTISPKNASAGSTVTLSVTPDKGFKIETLTVLDKNGKEVEVKSLGNGKYSFTMPSGKVTISATFKEIVDSTVCPQDATCVYAKFTDADTKAWYHDGVHFCVENGYMQGISATAFDPSGTTTRAMIVTMLWRMEGEPVANYAMSFKDVEADQWYTEAIRWAQSTGVVEGYSNEAFGPDDPITREQMATILYRYAKYHSIDVKNTNTLAGYTDVNKVSAWALDAMKWANAVGLVQGRTTTTLVPEVSITRAEAATMVQRYCENFVK